VAAGSRFHPGPVQGLGHGPSLDPLDGDLGPRSAEVSQFMEALLRPWRDDLAAIVAHGVEEGVFVPPDVIDDFTLRFVALLDGLALQRLRQLHQLSRKRVIELAMYAARAELAPGPQDK